MELFAAEQTKLRTIEPNKHLRICVSIIYYMGMWPKQGRYRYLYFLYTACSFSFMLGIILISEIANILANWGDVEKILAGVTLLMTNLTHTSKVTLIIRRHARIRDLVETTKSEMFSRDNVKYERIVTHYTWQGIFHHVAYQSFGAMAVLCWGFTPIANILAGRSKQLPQEGWYPYNATNSPAFEITSFYQTAAVVIGCVNNVAIDTLTTGLITVACCQLTLLNRNISLINTCAEKESISPGDNAGSGKSAAKTYDESYEDLKLYTRHSNMIFDFLKEIQNTFGTMIFLQFLVNCIIICLIAFNITQMKHYIPSILLGMVMYMCCMTYQIFIYCWHGNELYLHSSSILFAAYSSNWWHNTENFKRAIQVVMTRAQRPFILSAGNVMDLSLQTFVRILRMSYSIFTVLQSSTNT